MVAYSAGMIDQSLIRERFGAWSPRRDERSRRLFAATEAAVAGDGGIATVARTTGIAASTIGRGLKELAARTTLEACRVRRAGGGRRPLIATDSRLLDALNGLVEPEARGDPMSPLPLGLDPRAASAGWRTGTDGPSRQSHGRRRTLESANS